MPAPRPILLASAAAAMLIAGACSPDVSAPAGPTIAGAASPISGLFSASPSADTTGTDSIMPGYGPNCDPKYLEIPYDPTPPPQYIVCPHTTAVSRGLVAAGDTTPAPAPKPAPPPAPAP